MAASPLLANENSVGVQHEAGLPDYAEQCSICESDYVTPKSLKCLHSFCLKCLAEKVTASESIACPICEEITSLPSKGVEGLITNYLLIEKQERKSFEKTLKEKDTLIPCTSCENDTANKAVAWCRECLDYMCDEAAKYHKGQRLTKGHDVISLEKLQFEGLPSKGREPKDRKCPKHKDEKLKFYCETCEVPFCRDCEVIDHPRSEKHVQVYLEDAVRKRSAEINKEAGKCERIAVEVNEVIAQDKRVENALQKAVEQTLNDYDKEARQVHAKFSENQKQHKDNFETDLMRFNEDRRKKIDGHIQELKKVRSRIGSALAVSKMLGESGSQFDVADMYKDVITALRELGEFRPVAEHASNVSFKLNDDCIPEVEKLPTPGTLKLGTWELKYEFGEEGDGKLSSAQGLAFSPSGDLLVADHDTSNLIVFGNEGEFKSKIDPGFSKPVDITFTTTTEDCYVTDYTAYPRKFNREMAYQTNLKSGAHLCGITAIKDGGWAICSQSTNTIYVYNNAGSQTKTMSVMQPFFIAATSEDSFVITSENQKSVQVFDTDNQLVRTIGPPPNIVRWSPRGVCCTEDDEIYVTNRGTGSMGIYRFRISGEFIDCVASDMTNPRGLAISKDGEKMAVVDKDGLSVKVFGLV